VAAAHGLEGGAAGVGAGGLLGVGEGSDVNGYSPIAI
jgi:hypothetical protein